MNKAHLIGRLVAAPTAKATADGKSISEMRIAVQRKTDREKSDYFNVIAWAGLADVCNKHLTKGQKVAVSGELRSRTYEAEDGTKRYAVDIRADEIEFLERPKENKSEAGQLSLENLAQYDDENLPF